MHRPDPYHWLRDVDSPAVLAHLGAERAWYDTATGHLDSLVAALRTEMQARVPATDRSVSWRLGDCYYYTVLAEGREHPQLFRDRHLPVTEDSVSETAELLLDANLLDPGSGFVELGLTSVSPYGDWLAWSVDVTGDEVYTLRFRDLASGVDLDEEVPRSYYGGAWSADSRHFFYTVHDAAYRPHEVRRHTLGTPVSEDVLVLEEPDERYELCVRAPRSGGPVVLWAESRDTREVWVLHGEDPAARPLSVGGRRRGVEYHAEHLRLPDGSDQLLVVTNDGATEFRLAGAPVPAGADQDHTAWWPIRAEDPDERLERVEAFASHVVLALRRDGMRVLRLLPVDDLGGTGVDLTPAFPTGTLALGRNEDYDAGAVTVVDQSYVQPPVWSDVALDPGADGSGGARACDEVYTLRFLYLASGTDLDEVVPRSYYGGAWSADSRHFFYTVHDEAYRPYEVRRHTLGTPVTDDVPRAGGARRAVRAVRARAAQRGPGRAVGGVA